MTPCGCHAGSSGLSTPSRSTQTGRRDPVAPPVVYTSVPFSDRPRLTANPLPSTPSPSSKPIGEPVTSSSSGSNGTATSFPSAVATRRCPVGEYLAYTPRMSTFGSPPGSFIATIW